MFTRFIMRMMGLRSKGIAKAVRRDARMINTIIAMRLDFIGAKASFILTEMAM